MIEYVSKERFEKAMDHIRNCLVLLFVLTMAFGIWFLYLIDKVI